MSKLQFSLIFCLFFVNTVVNILSLFQSYTITERK